MEKAAARIDMGSPQGSTAGPIMPAHEGVRRLSVLHFLIALIVLLFTLPFVDQLKYGDLIETALVTFVFLSAVMAVGGRRRTLIAASLLVAPALVAKWFDHLQPNALPTEFTLFTAIAFSFFVVGRLLLFILRAPRVTAEVLAAAVAGFLMLGFLGAFANDLVTRLVPHSFVFTVDTEANRTMTAIDALYFSFGTLTNYYGDIIPVSRAARTLAMAEATAGLLYMAVLIARLVPLYSSTLPTHPTDAPNPPVRNPVSSERMVS